MNALGAAFPPSSSSSSSAGSGRRGRAGRPQIRSPPQPGSGEPKNPLCDVGSTRPIPNPSLGVPAEWETLPQLVGELIKEGSLFLSET